MNAANDNRPGIGKPAMADWMRRMTLSEEGQARFEAALEEIKANVRRRRQEARETFWNRATSPISDEQADYDFARSEHDWTAGKQPW